LGDRTLSFCFGNKEAAQFNFWEYINGNQTFILDSHQPFICSAGTGHASELVGHYGESKILMKAGSL
jgi:hypothetical protein